MPQLGSSRTPGPSTLAPRQQRRLTPLLVLQVLGGIGLLALMSHTVINVLTGTILSMPLNSTIDMVARRSCWS